jgi:hypothetical protein
MWNILNYESIVCVCNLNYYSTGSAACTLVTLLVALLGDHHWGGRNKQDRKKHISYTVEYPVVEHRVELLSRVLLI